MKCIIIAVVGAAEATEELCAHARMIGRGVAKRGWTLVTGGLSGVMEAASAGAHSEGGLVVGILPTASTASANAHVSVPIATNMGHARNAIIAHTADVVVAIGGSYGTLSEIAIARKLGKRVLALCSWNIEGVEAHSDPKSLLAALDEIVNT